MKEELRIRMDKGLKTLINANAKASSMNVSVYARCVFKTAGVLELSVITPVKKELSLQERQEKILKKAKQNGSN